MDNENLKDPLTRGFIYLNKIMLVGLLSLAGFVGYTNYRTGESVKNITQMVSEGDGIIDSTEAHSFLEQLGYFDLEKTSPIRTRNDQLYFQVSGDLPGLVNIYVGSEPFRNWRSDCERIATVPTKRLESFLEESHHNP